MAKSFLSKEQINLLNSCMAGGDEIAFFHQNALHAAAQFGCHVDFGGFDAAVAADETLAGALGAQGGPGIGARSRHSGQDGQKNQPVFEGGVHGA